MDSRIRAAAAVATLLAVVVALPSCSKKGSTQPVIELSSPDIGPGGTFTHVFAHAGTFAYHCAHHSAMKGTVDVQMAGAATDSVGIISSTTGGFSPATAHVGVGGTVKWKNLDAGTHTVTSD